MSNKPDSPQPARDADALASNGISWGFSFLLDDESSKLDHVRPTMLDEIAWRFHLYLQADESIKLDHVRPLCVLAS